MKKTALSFSLVLLISLCNCIFLQAQELPRTRTSFNEAWKFIKYKNASSDTVITDRELPGLQMPGANDAAWRTVDLPHDWAIEGAFNDTLENNTGLLPWKGISWYRKHFTVADTDKGKRIYIDFDGAMANAKVWLNGKYVGEWPYGYASFRLDLTPYLSFGGENIISVRLDTKNWDARWYPGAGIYRNVWLVKTSQVHIANNGVFCTTPEIKKDRAILSVRAEVESHLSAPLPVSVKAAVYKLNEKGERSATPVAESGIVTATLEGMKHHNFRLDIPVKDPVLWSIDAPERYKVIVSVLQGNSVSDSYETSVGFRTIVFTPRDGLFLNDKRIQIQGVNNHSNLGALGAAFNTRAAERQLEILKAMGCNAIRTSHNPPAPELLDLCDKMGFLIMVEAFDTWRIGKKKNDYNLQFDAWHEEDLRQMIRRDRNHPSVFMWSIGNEVPDQRNLYIATSLNAIVKSEDNTRPVTAGYNGPRAGTNGFQKTLDVFGLNYLITEYKQFYDLKDNANMGLFASESCSAVSSRGEYFFPITDGIIKVPPAKGIFQVSSYDVNHVASDTNIPDSQFAVLDKFPAVYGEFVWTGFDYMGEPTPYASDITRATPGTKYYEQTKKMLDLNGVTEVPSRSSYFGIIDLAGFPKDRYYIYQSRWRAELPMAHILPHWNWPERKGLVTPVHVYTSADEAELFLNGRSLGKKKKGQYEYRLQWNDVVYQPGELKVVAYRKGIKWAEDVVKTAGTPALLSASADRPAVRADGNDLIFITIKIEDKNKVFAPRSNNLVQFSIAGPGVIVAVDNGDATSHEPFQATYRKAYNGMCLVIVKAKKGASKSFIVKAESKGLKPATVKINIEN